MSEGIIVACISSIALIMVAGLNYASNRRQKATDERNKAADDRSKRIGKARLKRESAEVEKAEVVEKLTYLTALKVNQQKVNGELEATISDYRTKRDQCNKIIKESLKELENIYS